MKKKINWKRVARTFLQSFFATVAGDVGYILAGNTDERVLFYSILIPAVSSALAAVMNIEAEQDNQESEG